ncbi:hypothetical protein SCA6_007737 [Theobroma cacao]
MTSSGRPHNKVLWSLGFCDCLVALPVGAHVSLLAGLLRLLTKDQPVSNITVGAAACAASAIIYILIKVLIDCPSFCSCFYRTKMRQQYMLKGGGCGDCMLHCCCEICALTQEYRELKNRGFDMSIDMFILLLYRLLPSLSSPVSNALGRIPCTTNSTTNSRSTQTSHTKSVHLHT